MPTNPGPPTANGHLRDGGNVHAHRVRVPPFVYGNLDDLAYPSGIVNPVWRGDLLWVRPVCAEISPSPAIEKRMWYHPNVDAMFIDLMNIILDLYTRPYDPSEPIVCVDAGDNSY